MASLAHTVPSLARTVLKPSVLQQRGTRRQRQLVLTDGMGWMGWDGMGWDGMDGMDGMDARVGPLFFFGSYLENYSIIISNFYWTW